MMTSRSIGARPRQRVTLHTLAAATGVSKSAVSRILNAAPLPTDSEAVQRVRRIAAESGYIRNNAAAQLRLGQSRTIGVVVVHLTDAVMAMFHEAVASECAATGRIAIAASTAGQERSAQTAVDTLLRQGVDGIIMTTAQLGDALTKELRERGVPFVLALRNDGIGPAAVGDDEMGGLLATRHLIEHGHTRIAMITGTTNGSPTLGRLTGFHKAMEEAGLAVAPELIVPSNYGFESGGEAARKLMALPEPPTAIFAVNDGTAIGAMSALLMDGLSVPRDVSIVGYSDIPISRHLPVRLTTVRVPYDAIARDALALLDGQITGKVDDPGASPIRMSTPELIERGSVAPPRS